MSTINPALKTMGGVVLQDDSRFMPMFDGKLIVYSTCRDCKGIMQVVRPDEYVHPTCTPKPTRMESLLAGWLSCIEAGDEESAKLTEQEIEKLDKRPVNLKAIALQYISRGWPVFPLRPREKTPATRNGFKDATTDLDAVTRWWTTNPDYNIGLPTGIMFDVIDIDPQNGGVISFTNLLSGNAEGDKRFRAQQIHGVATTASGGIHLYVKPTGTGNLAGIRTGIDYRGKGGYVVAPGSNLGREARSWRWSTVPSPEIKKG